MNGNTPSLREPNRADADHLKLLSVFHFVGAGLALLGILFLIAHFAMFHALMDHPKLWENPTQSPPPQEFFAIFQWFYLVAAVVLLGYGILNLASGLFLRARKHRTFSIVVAGFNCVHVPLGTVLGVFTIIVLMRDSVRELYMD